MSKPEDIPQDVWDKARKPAKIACAPHNTPQIAHAIVARAILAAKAEEREACALVAEQIGIPAVTHRPVLRIEMVPVEIAAAIRKRGEG